MMAELKPMASLSPGLLARKGFAKPAMRRQVLDDGMGNVTPINLDDLGWNDMGYENTEGDVFPLTPVHAQIERLENSIREYRKAQSTGLTPYGADQMAEDQPEGFLRVKAPVNLGGHSFAEENMSDGALPNNDSLPLPKKVVKQVKRDALSGQKSDKKKAAFTLRLDNERHLKLKLASAMQQISAQQLVIRALDKMFEELPELEALITDSVEQSKSFETGDR